VTGHELLHLQTLKPGKTKASMHLVEYSIALEKFRILAANDEVNIFLVISSDAFRPSACPSLNPASQPYKLLFLSDFSLLSKERWKRMHERK